eukprot:3939184-Rhodomonas_salina.1
MLEASVWSIVQPTQTGAEPFRKFATPKVNSVEARHSRLLTQAGAHIAVACILRALVELAHHHAVADQRNAARAFEAAEGVGAVCILLNETAPPSSTIGFARSVWDLGFRFQVTAKQADQHDRPQLGPAISGRGVRKRCDCERTWQLSTSVTHSSMSPHSQISFMTRPARHTGGTLQMEMPLPTKPVLHEHEKLPTVSTHSALSCACGGGGKSTGIQEREGRGEREGSEEEAWKRKRVGQEHASSVWVSGPGSQLVKWMREMGRDGKSEGKAEGGGLTWQRSARHRSHLVV